jgi:hypothetical protein
VSVPGGMARLSHVLIPERPAGVEPGTIRRMVLPPWQGGRLPPTNLRSVPAWALGWKPNCQRPKSTGPRLRRGARTRTLVAAVRKRCLRR